MRFLRPSVYEGRGTRLQHFRVGFEPLGSGIAALGATHELVGFPAERGGEGRDHAQRRTLEAVLEFGHVVPRQAAGLGGCFLNSGAEAG